MQVFFFYLGFVSPTFTIHCKTREGGGYFFNSSLLLPSASQFLDISQAIAAAN